jgi:hypothetical protein
MVPVACAIKTATVIFTYFTLRGILWPITTLSSSDNQIIAADRRI